MIMDKLGAWRQRVARSAENIALDRRGCCGTVAAPWGLKQYMIYGDIPGDRWELKCDQVG